MAVLPTYVFDERFSLSPDDPGNQLAEPVRTIYARCRGRAHLLRRSAKWCLAGVFVALILGVGAVIGASWLASFDIEQAGKEVERVVDSKRSEIQGIEERLKAADLNVEKIRRRIEEDLGHAGAVWDQADTGIKKRAILDVHFLADGRAGWAVGDVGTILATTDGGETWEPRTSGTTKWLGALHFMADGRAGWAVGDVGTILATTDGGETWEPRTSGTTKWLGALHFLADGRAGWAVGRAGTILATTDGSETWEPRTSGTKEWLWAVHFLADGRAGWAVGQGEEGTILVSRQQEPVPTVPSIEPNSDALIQFLSKETFPSLFMAPVYKEQLENKTEDSKELERTREQLVTEIQTFTQGEKEDGKSSISFLTNITAIRAGIIVLILFLVQILVHLSRYNTRLAGFYSARADVLLLIGEKQWVKERPTVAEVLEMMDAFSPDRLDFGKAPATAVDRIANLARSVTPGGSRA